jgi:DNA-binding transcriptional LysR family regulator
MDWLNYHHLRYFWTVAKEGGLRQAAARLHVSQPSISAQIRELEEALGERLFGGRGAPTFSRMPARSRSVMRTRFSIWVVS